MTFSTLSSAFTSQLIIAKKRSRWLHQIIWFTCWRHEWLCSNLKSFTKANWRKHHLASVFTKGKRGSQQFTAVKSILKISTWLIYKQPNKTVVAFPATSRMRSKSKFVLNFEFPVFLICLRNRTVLPNKNFGTWQVSRNFGFFVETLGVLQSVPY